MRTWRFCRSAPAAWARARTARPATRAAPWAPTSRLRWWRAHAGPSPTPWSAHAHAQCLMLCASFMHVHGFTQSAIMQGLSVQQATSRGQPAIIQASGPSLPQAGSHCKVVLSAWQPKLWFVALAAGEAESVRAKYLLLPENPFKSDLHCITASMHSCARKGAGAVAVERGLERIRL